MTLFEYLAIAFGLLYSVAALRILGGLRSAFDASRRYWVHLGMNLILLAAVAGSFWAFWSYREVPQWTFPSFLLALTLPGLIYFMAASLVPGNPEAVPSWKEFYFDARLPLFLGLALWALSAAANATVSLGMSPVHPARIVHLAALVIGLVGAATSRERVHEGIVVVCFGLVVVWGVTIGLAPGPMAR